jgi:hypothetical protein
MGVLIGPLLERGTRRALVGVTSVYLPRGMTCDLAIGTLVRVEYSERDGRRMVKTIRPLPEERLVWPRSADRVEGPRKSRPRS